MADGCAGGKDQDLRGEHLLFKDERSLVNLRQINFSYRERIRQVQSTPEGQGAIPGSLERR
jgi:hypothetical protein